MESRNPADLARALYAALATPSFPEVLLGWTGLYRVS
jgi:hypothetical protein